MGRTPELFGVWKVMLDDWGVFKAGRYRMITPPPPPHKTKKKKKNIARILLEIRGLKYVGKCWNLQPMLLVGLTLYWDRWLHPPAELTNPSQLVTPSCIFVCVSVCTCVSPKKKHWQVCCGEDGEWICFGMCLCMCTCLESSVSWKWCTKKCLSIVLENVN